MLIQEKLGSISRNPKILSTTISSNLKEILSRYDKFKQTYHIEKDDDIEEQLNMLRRQEKKSQRKRRKRRDG